jgi:hypothetical protein
MPKKDITAHQRTRRWHDGLAAINAAGAANDIPDILDIHGKKLDLDMVSYGGLRDTTAIDAAVFVGKPYSDRDDLELVFAPGLQLRVAIERAVDALNSAQAAEYLGAVTAYAALFGIDMTNYGRLSEEGKDNVHDTVFNGIPYANEGAVKTAADGAIATEITAEAVAAVNAAIDANEMGDALLAYADVLALLIGPGSDYAALEAAGQAAVIGAVLSGRPGDPGYANAAAIKAAFDAAVEDELEDQAVAAVNSADAEGMGAVLAQYAVPLTLDLTAYSELDETKQGNVHTALVGKSFADAAAVKTAFDAAVQAAQGE